MNSLFFAQNAELDDYPILESYVEGITSTDADLGAIVIETYPTTNETFKNMSVRLSEDPDPVNNPDITFVYGFPSDWIVVSGAEGDFRVLDTSAYPLTPNTLYYFATSMTGTGESFVSLGIESFTTLP